jgi:DNA-binding CsgD family transcriptional regulator
MHGEAGSPMIGRQNELNSLIRGLERAQHGIGSVALIGGEAGIGKTTLARELRSAAATRGIDVLWGRTPEAAWAGPYAPWVEALERLNTASGPLFQTADELSAEDRQAQIHDRVLRALSALTQRTSALLVLEDLHWAQSATLDLLRHVAFGTARSSILIVGTYRASGAAPHLPLGKTLGHLRHEAEVPDLSLTGLDRADLQQLLGNVTRQQVDRVLAETKGNPLYALALATALRETTAVTRATATDDSDLPLALRQAIGQRLDALSAPTQRVLSTASIFEDAFDVTLLATLLSLSEDEVIEALDEATLQGFVQSGLGLDEFVFSHAIVRQAVLANWQPARLVRERRRIAELLAASNRRNNPGEIASLYHRSRTLAGASAGVSYAMEAAEEARSSGAHEQTAAFLQMARDMAEQDDERREEILRGLAIALAESLQIEPAISTGWQAIELMEATGVEPDEIANFSADIAVALKHRAGATPEQWTPFVNLGLQRVDQKRGLGWARLSFVLDPVEPISRSGIRAGKWTGFDPQAVALARAKGTEVDQARSFESFDSRTRAETDALLALARGFRNPYARLHALTVVGNDLQYRHGAFRDALRVWNEIETLAERHGAVGWQAQALNQRALIEIALGELKQADATERQANELLARLGPGRRPELFAMEMATARACYLGGEFDKLSGFWIAFADDPALGPGEPASLLGPFFASVGAFTAAEASLPDRARSTLAMLTPLLEHMPLDAPNHNGTVAFGALAVWNLRDQKAAPVYRRLLGRMLEAGIQDYPQTSLALSLARMSALLDRADEAESAFALARTQLEASGQIPLRAITDYEHAAWLTERARPELDRAGTLVANAVGEFERLEMPFWQERATALRDTIERRKGPATYPAGITERELEVLKLAVQGHSDKEISELLFISPRTVNAHMRNMFAKTGSSNRTELSVWAVAQGLVEK